MDRVDKILLVLPFLPVADLLSTLFSLTRGAQEVGILARPILELYGSYGLIMLAASASIVFFVLMRIVLYIKKLFVSEFKFRWMWYVLAIPIYWFFVLEGVYLSTVVMNFLIALIPLLTQTIILRALIVCAYFFFVSALTMSQIKQLPHF